MKEAFHYFLAADTYGMSSFKWAMTIVFTFFLLISIYLIWKRGQRNIDTLSLLLILILLFRSCYPLFLRAGSPDMALRLLFFLFPVGMAVLIHFIFTKQKNFHKEQMVVGLTAVFLTIVNIALGGALNFGSPHWWAETYPLKVLNQIWLLGSIAYSIAIILRMTNDLQTYSRFIVVANIGLIIYLFGHLLLSISTTMDMYWVYRYHAFVSDILMIYAYAYLLWSLYRTIGQVPPEAELSQLGLDIYEVMSKVPADKLSYFLEVNHPGSIPKNMLELTPRQQLQAILMINKVSIKESAEYSFITPNAVKVYRSRIRQILI